MTTKELNLERDKAEKDPSPALNSDNSSFSNYIDQKEIMPYKLFLKENIKSFNLLPNEESCSKENELENSLKAKYHLDTPLLEIILKITSDYDLIQKQLREYLELFGEINSLKYDHNANTVKISYKYYFSCLYANRSLSNIIQNPADVNSAINYYSNCDFSNKSINTAISNENNNSKISANKDFNQAFKFLTENYKTNTKFKTQIYKGENDENRCQNITVDEEPKNNNISEKRTNIEENKNNEKEYMLSPKLKSSNDIPSKNLNSFNNSRIKNRWNNSNNNYYSSRKKTNNSFSNQMNNLFFPSNLFYQYLSMNNPNTIKIPVPVPVPVPIPMNISSKKFSKDPHNNSNKNKHFSSFSKTKIKSSCLKPEKEKENENMQNSLNKTKMQTKSLNETNSPKMKSDLNTSNINNFCDTIIENTNININNSEKSIAKSNNITEKENNTSDFEKKEEININSTEAKDGNSYKENISSSNVSGKSSQEIRERNDIVNSIKFTEKNKIDFLNTMDHRNLSLDRLNYFLQNNKPISNFNNPVKNLSSEENEVIPMHPNNLPLPLFYPFPMQFPMNFPKFGRNRPHPNQYFFPNGFNKNIIDFDKLILHTKNTIKFETYSSRDYYYKYVCNYLVQIENDDKFFVTKRIIGKNGCFLKKIIQEACIKYGDFSTKIRLRGKGSGYLEQNGKESEEPLMLCVSSLNYPTYTNCCILIDSLLKKVYNDYYDYLLKVLSKDLHHSLIKKRILKHEYVVNRYTSGKNKDDKNCNYNPKREDNSSQECICDEKNN